MGGALASALTEAGHDVVVAASNSEKAAEAAAGLECEPAPSPREAADGADAVVLAIPFKPVTKWRTRFASKWPESRSST